MRKAKSLVEAAGISCFSALFKLFPQHIEFVLLIVVQLLFYLQKTLIHYFLNLGAIFEEKLPSLFSQLLNDLFHLNLLLWRQLQLFGKLSHDEGLSGLRILSYVLEPVFKIDPRSKSASQDTKDKHQQ